MDWQTILEQGAGRDPRFGRVVQGFRGPSVPLRMAVLCGFAVVVVPLVLLLLTGVLVGVTVFAVASLVLQIGEMLGLTTPADGSGDAAPDRPAVPGDEYRENVRVVPRG